MLNTYVHVKMLFQFRILWKTGTWVPEINGILNLYSSYECPYERMINLFEKKTSLIILINLINIIGTIRERSIFKGWIKSNRIRTARIANCTRFKRDN